MSFEIEYDRFHIFQTFDFAQVPVALEDFQGTCRAVRSPGSDLNDVGFQELQLAFELLWLPQPTVLCTFDKKAKTWIDSFLSYMASSHVHECRVSILLQQPTSLTN